MSFYPQYPESMPCPNWQYSVSRTEFQRSAQFDCGWTRKRDQFPEHGGGVSLSFNMTTQEFASWSRWMKANAHDWFSINLEPGPSGPIGPQVIRGVGDITWNYDDYGDIVAQMRGEFRATT